MSEQKPREWWIVHRRMGYDLAFKSSQENLDALEGFSQTHAVEYLAYDQALARLAEAERVLEWYADKENYNGECAPTYDQKSITNDPESIHDFGFEYDSGQKAREFLGKAEK